MITLSNLSQFYGEQTLFEGVSLQFNPAERYGIVGANGSGKSTLLRLIGGDELPSGGEIAIPKRCRLGVLRQDHFRHEEQRILDVVMMGDRELWSAMVEKEAVLAHADVEFDGDRYAALEELVVHRDGYSLEARAAEILEGLGIVAAVHHDPLGTLSGGFKLRVLLAQVLAAAPDVLVLDEPTNHLDILSIRWLEKFLVSTFAGCTLVVSHDHRFLDNVASHIVDVDYETITVYPGNYQSFVEQKREDRERREREIEKREKEIAHHKEFVERFRYKASKARQAQSKIKLIEKIEIEPLPQSSRRYPSFRFRPRRPSGKQVVAIEGVAKSYGDLAVLRGVGLTIARGERVAIIGPNGIGKSTLLKILMAQVPPDAGRVEWGYETHPGYFAQDHRAQLGAERKTIEDWLWEFCPGEPIGFVRGHLGAVLFSGDEVKKRLVSLSGGEAARLLFARFVIEQPNVLVLDEPTNHLDLEAIESLVDGLRSYDGTILFVSHDRWFVSEIATRIIEISARGINDFPGTYEEYLERLGDDHLDAEAVLRRARAERKQARAEPGRTAPGDPAARRKRKALAGRLEQITTEVERAESRVNSINEQFCDPTFFERNPRSEVTKLEREQQQQRERIDGLMREWQQLEDELAALPQG